MRGSRMPSATKSGLSRNTPAYAGITKEGNFRPTTERKHPRVCGDHEAVKWCPVVREETPPRMRGSRREARNKQGVDGNTPAYAGITRQDGAVRASDWKHPRVCGDHAVTIYENWDKIGNTPAYAGITGFTARRGFFFLETPPRMRGSHR